jgi:molybdenum cofactor cytidylyltransferase
MIAALVLAAGLSRRMGRPKLLLPLGGQSVIRRTVEPLIGQFADVVVVTGPSATAIHDELAGCSARFAVNPRPEDGQGTSVAAGVAALDPATRAVLILLGDQPALPSALIPALLAAFERTGKAIVAPVYRGFQGTPVLFAAAVFPELRALTGDRGARAVVGARPERVERVEFDIPEPADLDTPEDYARLRVE